MRPERGTFIALGCGAALSGIMTASVVLLARGGNKIRHLLIEE